MVADCGRSQHHRLQTHAILLDAFILCECAQLRVEDAEDNMYASIDLVCDKVARKMGRVKDHAISTGKWHGKGRGQWSQADIAADQVWTSA